MRKFFYKILYQGTSQDALDSVNLRIINTNVAYITLPIVYTLFIFLELENYMIPVTELKWDQFIFIVEILICALGVLLNRYGYGYIGKLIFLVTWPFLLHIIPIWHQQSPNDYFFAFPMGLAFHSMLIQLMVSRKKEPATFYSLLVANFLLTVFSLDILLAFSTQTGGTLFELVSSEIYRHVCVLYWLLFSLAAFFVAYSIEHLFKRIEVDQLLIMEQKEELQAINEELKASNDALNALNEQMAFTNQNLELAVQKRTELIENQNHKLREYAFYNAHKLRAPFCRIKGLLYLAEITNANESAQITELLKKSVDEMADVIGEIQAIVEDEAVVPKPVTDVPR